MIQGPGDDCDDETETDGMSIKAGDLLGGGSDHCLGVMRLKQAESLQSRLCSLEEPSVC